MFPPSLIILKQKQKTKIYLFIKRKKLCQSLIEILDRRLSTLYVHSKTYTIYMTTAGQCDPTIEL